MLQSSKKTVFVCIRLSVRTCVCVSEKETCRCLAFSRLYHTTAVVPRFVLAFSLSPSSFRFDIPRPVYTCRCCATHCALCPLTVTLKLLTELGLQLRAVLKLQTNHSVSTAAVIAHTHTYTHAFSTCVGHTHCASARRKQCYPSASHFAPDVILILVGGSVCILRLF